MNTGLVYVFTGEGKGKTSAALGVAVRSLLLEKRVVWVAFYKQESWGLSEAKMKDKFPNLEMEFAGKGFRIGRKTAPVGTKGHVVIDTASEEEHKEAAETGLQLAMNVLNRKSSDRSPKIAQGSELESQKPFLLVMDEVLNAVTDGLITEKEVVEVLEMRGETHIVLTGRADPHLTRMILVRCDLVTECRKIKHPYDTGKLAVAGLDY